MNTTATIAVIEDDETIRTLLQMLLKNAGFTSVRTAERGDTGLELVRRHKPDLVLLDLMMPGIDGFEVIRRLRADEATKDLPIIILSALNSEQDISKGFQLGANDFINKPIIMEKLLSSVTTQINLQAAKAQAG